MTYVGDRFNRVQNKNSGFNQEHKNLRDKGQDLFRAENQKKQISNEKSGLHINESQGFKLS